MGNCDTCQYSACDGDAMRLVRLGRVDILSRLRWLLVVAALWWASVAALVMVTVLLRVATLLVVLVRRHLDPCLRLRLGGFDG